MDKEKAKKVIFKEDDFYSYDYGDNIDGQPSIIIENPYCPVCDHLINLPANYCSNCGQKLKWGDNDE